MGRMTMIVLQGCGDAIGGQNACHTDGSGVDERILGEGQFLQIHGIDAGQSQLFKQEVEEHTVDQQEHKAVEHMPGVLLGFCVDIAHGVKIQAAKQQGAVTHKTFQNAVIGQILGVQIVGVENDTEDGTECAKIEDEIGDHRE